MNADTNNNKTFLLFILALVVIALMVSSILRHRAFERAGVSFMPAQTAAPSEGRYTRTPGGEVVVVNSVPTQEQMIENVKKINEQNLIVKKAIAEQERRIREVRAEMDNAADKEQASTITQSPEKNKAKKTVVIVKPTQEMLDKIKSGAYLIAH